MTKDLSIFLLWHTISVNLDIGIKDFQALKNNLDQGHVLYQVNKLRASRLLTVEIDMRLDMLSYLKDAKVFERNIQNPNYKQIFDKTAKRIYKVITGRGCPESVKVIWSGATL